MGFIALEPLSWRRCSSASRWSRYRTSQFEVEPLLDRAVYVRILHLIGVPFLALISVTPEKIIVSSGGLLSRAACSWIVAIFNLYFSKCLPDVVAWPR